jgi:class 3 adenylate cyclase
MFIKLCKLHNACNSYGSFCKRLKIFLWGMGLCFMFICAHAQIDFVWADPLRSNVSERNKYSHEIIYQDVTVMFCDIRGFTQLCEQNNTQSVMNFLRDYLSALVLIVERYKGSVEKFLGDGALVVFKTTEKISPQEACMSAVRVAEELTECIKKCNPQMYGLKNISHNSLENGVGINFGTVCWGCLGTPHCYDYTLIGDVVNCAQRLEGLNKDNDIRKIVKRHIVISKTVYDLLSFEEKKNFIFCKTCDLVGHCAPVHVYGYSV